MSARGRQRGAVVAIVLVVVVLVALTFAATSLVSRLTGSGDERTTTDVRLAKAAAALEQFASATGRLPCPAVPTLDEGIEKASGDVCHADAQMGTVPWKTIGLRRADSLDAWGRKITYRVFTGDNVGNGSLTRDQGASMVMCDSTDPSPAITATGLCNATPYPYLRNTTPALYLAALGGWDGSAKGLEVTDFGTARSDIAFVLVSHGASGLGGYSTTGVRRELPIGDERTNTLAAGTFVAKAFSDPDVAATANAHFDDIVFFRSLPDLVRNASLVARDWPEDLVAAFNRQAVAAVLGVDAASLGGDTGVNTMNFGGDFTVSGFRGGSATNISFDELAGTGGLGVFGGTSNRMSSATNDVLRLQLTNKFRKFAITLNDFSAYSTGSEVFLELATLTFYDGTTQVATTTLVACVFNNSPQLASYSRDVGVDFNRVDIQPNVAIRISPSFGLGLTEILVSEFQACPASTGTCATGLATSNPASACA